MAKEKKRDIFVRILSVVVSFSLWIYIVNVENPQKSTKVNNVPVKIENLKSLEEQNLALLPNQEVMVTLEISGKASTVYSVTPSDFRVVADLSDLALKKGENFVPIDITSFPNGVDVSPSQNVKAIINIDEYAEREVNISSEFKASAAPGYHINQIDINPSVATIKGPSEYVNRVTSLTVEGIKDNLNEDYKEISSLIPVDENGNEVSDIVITPLFVEVLVQVYRTKTVPINIDTVGSPGEGIVIIDLVPKPKEILISGPDSILNQVNKIDTEKLDISEILKSQEVIQPLVLPKDIKAVKGEVSVITSVEVEVSGEIGINKEINILGLSENLNASLSVDSINIFIKGPKSKLDSLQMNSVLAEINLDGYEEGTYEIEPKVVVPAGLTFVTTNPEIISVTLELKEEEE